MTGPGFIPPTPYDPQPSPSSPDVNVPMPASPLEEPMNQPAEVPAIDPDRSPVSVPDSQPTTPTGPANPIAQG